MMRAIAVDDSLLALDLLEGYAKRSGLVNLEHKCTSALEAAKILRKGSYDLVFLDIQMPDFSGIDLARIIDKKTKVIFTTAYSDFAVEGFNLDATDYLLKPFPFERFCKAVNKAAEQLKRDKDPVPEVQQDPGKFIYLKSGYETIKVFLRDILYIEALKDYIQVYTTQGKVMSLLSMKDILSALPPEDFIRVHRSYIVPFSRVSRVGPKKIEVAGKEIPLGEVFRSSFQLEMNKRITDQG